MNATVWRVSSGAASQVPAGGRAGDAGGAKFEYTGRFTVKSEQMTWCPNALAAATEGTSSPHPRTSQASAVQSNFENASVDQSLVR